MDERKAWAIVAEEAERGLETLGEPEARMLAKALDIIEDIIIEYGKKI